MSASGLSLVGSVVHLMPLFHPFGRFWFMWKLIAVLGLATLIAVPASASNCHVRMIEGPSASSKDGREAAMAKAKRRWRRKVKGMLGSEWANVRLSKPGVQRCSLGRVTLGSSKKKGNVSCTYSAIPCRK